MHRIAEFHLDRMRILKRFGFQDSVSDPSNGFVHTTQWSILAWHVTIVPHILDSWICHCLEINCEKASPIICKARTVGIVYTRANFHVLSRARQRCQWRMQETSSSLQYSRLSVVKLASSSVHLCTPMKLRPSISRLRCSLG